MNINRNYSGMLLGLIFGLLFTVGGTRVLYETAFPVWRDWYAMQSWHNATAQLLEVSDGENETRARYRYDINGVTYSGDRVYVSLMKDTIGSYHRDLYKRLLRQKNAGKPVSIWVDSNAPGRAVIDRDMRWGFFALMSGFSSVFIIIGLLVIYFQPYSG